MTKIKPLRWVILTILLVVFPVAVWYLYMIVSYPIVEKKGERIIAELSRVPDNVPREFLEKKVLRGLRPAPLERFPKLVCGNVSHEDVPVLNQQRLTAVMYRDVLSVYFVVIYDYAGRMKSYFPCYD